MYATVPVVVSGQVPAIARASAARGWPHVLSNTELRGLALSVQGQVFARSPNRTTACSATYARAHQVTRVVCQVSRRNGSFAVFSTRRPEGFTVWEDGSYRFKLIAQGETA